MPRKGENIFKRKDGRWEARYIHHYENGVARYHSLYAKSYSEVKAKKQAAVSLASTQASLPTRGARSFEELARLWLCDVRMAVKESTYTRYDRAVRKYILPYIGNRPLHTLDSLAVNTFGEALLKGGGAGGNPLSPKTVTDILCVLKAILHFGYQNKLMSNIVDGIRYPKKCKKEIKVLKPENLSTLEKILIRSEDTTSIGILLSLFTGIRIGELCGLRWSDFDFTNGILSIRRTVERITDLTPNATSRTKVVVGTPKTATALRTIPLPSFIIEKLRRFSHLSQQYVITGRDTFIEPHTFYIRYRRFMRKHGMDAYPFHALRHTFATRCVVLGFDAKSLAEILGHASISTTLSVYVHPSLEEKRKQMEMLVPCANSLS